MARSVSTAQTSEQPTTRVLAQKTVQANKEHQHALKVYTERLEVELETVDKLLDAADADQEDELEPDTGGFVLIPGSVKVSGFLAPSEFLSEDSPFRDDSARRARYLSFTESHPMKGKELDTLTEAVRTENYRRCALDAQRRGHQSFADMSDQSPDYLELNKEGLDWDRIAEKVSSVSTSIRTARECEIRWLGDRHPEFNHDPWQQDEIAKLRALVAENKDGQIDWTDMAKKLGTNRTPLDCMRHGTIRKIHQWTTESDERLLSAIKYRGLDNWLLVAQYVSEDATPQQCANRWQRTLDPNIQRGNWSPEEDARLRLAVDAFGSSWVNVASVIAGRTNDQCRDRWSDKLNPILNKSKWTAEEDRALMSAVSILGTSNWKSVSERLGTGRADSMCRSHYEVLKKAKKAGKPKRTPATFSVISQPPIESSQVAGPSRPRARQSSKSNDAANPEVCDDQELTPEPVPMVPTFVFTRTADSEIMFLDPIVDSNPEGHKEQQKTAMGMAKGQVQNKTKDPSVATTQASTSKRAKRKKPTENVEGAPPAKKRKPVPRRRRREDPFSSLMSFEPDTTYGVEEQPSRGSLTTSNQTAVGTFSSVPAPAEVPSLPMTATFTIIESNEHQPEQPASIVFTNVVPTPPSAGTSNVVPERTNTEATGRAASREAHERHEVAVSSTGATSDPPQVAHDESEPPSYIPQSSASNTSERRREKSQPTMATRVQPRRSTRRAAEPEVSHDVNTNAP
ncbi:hypothetical protein BV22DRAFT_1190583 [Leucogyrophana mollusca]|uniref:Uncharacterized protein n=1 Tax=Leucogyrophana mollusca TaxID=85980 RepID=A0ACB8C157_9AGAM|nr:hypothetical protein BV22DRAFT_1190583 [Leucogyrophana mollusca]